MKKKELKQDIQELLDIIGVLTTFREGTKLAEEAERDYEAFLEKYREIL